MDALIGGVGALVAAAAASLFVLRLIRGRLVDVPNERSSHRNPTPRGGGISIVLGVMSGLLIAGHAHAPLTAAFFLALTLGAIGFIDDVRGLAVSVRLSLQVTVGTVGLVWVIDRLPDPTWLAAISAVIAAIWIVGYTNAFNFMDGINGISAGQLIVAGVCWAIIGEIQDLEVVTVIGAVTAGAALGFLPWNFPRARFFMGDVGSYFCGGWLAACTIVGIQLGVPSFAMLAPLLIYGADTAITLFRRIARGEPWYTAHRDHVYQQLVVGGWSHVRTTAFYAVVAMAVAASGLMWLVESTLPSAIGSTLAAIVLAAYLASPAALQRFRVRQTKGTS